MTFTFANAIILIYWNRKKR